MTATMASAPARIAARNNAAWCDAVCRAHGGETATTGATWHNASPSPRFYPNIVTLRERQEADVLATLQRLDDRLPAGWGIKDSFADLHLRSRGFAPVFEASWIWRDASASFPRCSADETLAWACVGDDEALARWERAWDGDAAEAGTARRQFPVTLLEDSAIVFVAGRRGDRIVAGGVFNLAAGAVGISNVFAPMDDLRACWTRLIVQAMQRFPGLPQCGYVRPEQLALSRRLGFEPVGPLRVWLRSADVVPRTV